MYLMHVQVESIKKQTKETKNDKFKMITASAVAFYIPVTTFTCPRKDRRFTIQWVFGETPWIEKRTTLIQKGVSNEKEKGLLSKDYMNLKQSFKLWLFPYGHH